MQADFQFILVMIFGAVALIYLGIKFKKSFAKDELCNQGCGCAVTDIKRAQKEMRQ